MSSACLPGVKPVDIAAAAERETAWTMERLGTSVAGLGADDARRRLVQYGPNVVRSHSAGALTVMRRQLVNPLLLLLVLAAVVSAVVGELTDALIVLLIVSLSVGLGFANEWRSERAIDALRSAIRHTAVAIRDGVATIVDVRHLVPGDVVRLDVGDVIPADLRLLDVNGLECDEAVLTGESEPAEKFSAPARNADSPLDLASCAFMGTVVRNGSATGVVVGSGAGTAFGRIAARLGERHEETAFQHGLRQFSRLLVHVTAALCAGILVVNVALHRPFLDAVLFSLAIAVGLTPQLLPAIVTVSLSTGARRLARRSVVVKRLVSIEDLGNVEVLFTDKTGTLTEGELTFVAALNAAGLPSPEVLELGLLCSAVITDDDKIVGGNALDRSLNAAADAAAVRHHDGQVLARLDFDYERRLMSVLAQIGDEVVLITKGAPEAVLERCRAVDGTARAVLDDQFTSGRRVVAVARRDGAGVRELRVEEERDLILCGFLVFSDPPKKGVKGSLRRLANLGITLKIVTGDNERVARRLCDEVGIDVCGVLTGTQLNGLDDAALVAAIPSTTVFARVTPEQKSRIVRAERTRGRDVGFLGDGVNDAVALHDADVGISVDSASEVAKDAADIILLSKDLDLLADGVVEGRRIFANTVKYVLMATSSNFGNMFSAAGASLFLSFLPMLPTQILLNNLLYDVSEMTIPTDEVDEEALARPAHWDTNFIRRFMVIFGPISSVFDFLTFGLMLWIFSAGPTLFRSGWFVESLATQTLVIFVIRTRRVPFVRSRPSRPLLVATLSCAATGAVLPFSPLASTLGFTALPLGFFALLLAMIAVYLGLVELGMALFNRSMRRGRTLATHRSARERRVRRLVTRWTHHPHAENHG